jgi:2-C-methyl-D-erythritol 4-phosphate cytidylyltransferase
MGSPPDVLALIAGAGSGERLGADRPKALVELCGRALIEYSVEALAQAPSIAEMVIALPEELLGGEIEERLLRLGERVRARCVAGGESRSQSVRKAFEAGGGGELVLIHDAARPLVDAELAERVIALARTPEIAGAVAAAPVTDTIKRAWAPAEDWPPLVLETLDRTGLWSAQTPQVFRRAALAKALAVDPPRLERASDDAWLVERSHGRVVLLPNDGENIKVTYPLDLTLAGALLARRARDEGAERGDDLPD